MKGQSNNNKDKTKMKHRPLHRLMFSAMVTLGIVSSLPCRTEAASRPQQFVPDFKVRPDDYTVLTACVGKHPAGSKPVCLDHRQLQLRDWKPGSENSWEVEVLEPGDYAVNVLFNHSVKFPLKVEVTGGSSRVSSASTRETVLVNFLDHDGQKRQAPSAPQSWRRLPLAGELRLPKGKMNLVLTITGAEGQKEGAIELLSIELVRTDVKERLRKSAAAFRAPADTQWFRNAKYGLMVHWTSTVYPRQGTRLPYQEAVRRFRLNDLVEQLVDTGAGFLTFTTSHEQMFIPAPIKSLDAVLPGRTCERDLIQEMADALNQRGLKLFLYYHLGCNSDAQWQQASGFWETDTTRFWSNWCAVIGEMGGRYDGKLAGWWFDDGTANYYYRSAPWETLAKAAIQGNPNRLVGFNPWILPLATEFQNCFLGEAQSDPTVKGTLKPGDNGIISSGMYKGLQASAALVMEADWGHWKKDTEIAPPKQTPEQLAELVRRFIALGNVPMLNCEIYQDGTLSPKTVEVLKGMKDLLAKSETFSPEKKAVNR